MSLRARVKAVIFDMDGLMFDTERIAQTAWQHAASKFGYDFPAETYAGIIGLALPDVAQYTRTTFGANFPFDSIYLRKQELVDEWITIHGTPLKAGLLELMDQVERADLRMALASSSGKGIILRNLEHAGLQAERFNAIVGGDEISRGKPAPDIFLAASRRLGAMPAECLVLEDSNTGIQAACAAGMIAIMVPDMLSPSDATMGCAWQILPDLYAVRDLLLEENGRQS
jgi:HAD superfamily hydrolase (TIGR01509 family)